jgi:predicted metalloprotease with PDZ domain
MLPILLAIILLRRTTIAFGILSPASARRERLKDKFQGLSPLHISSGLTFEDGNQILVSVQKPLGLILEQDETDNVIRIADVDPTGSAASAGLRVGDLLVAVQNADMIDKNLEYALAFIAQAPKVLNLRFVRLAEETQGD